MLYWRCIDATLYFNWHIKPLKRLTVKEVKKLKKCNPPPKVREAGRKLSTSQSPAVKSVAGRKLAEHKHKNH